MEQTDAQTFLQREVRGCNNNREGDREDLTSVSGTSTALPVPGIFPCLLQELDCFFLGDGILEGFLEAESVHGLRYTRFIGDGDSLVHSALIQSVPWGYAIQKLECANMHANATEVHSRLLYNRIPHTKAVVDSLKRCGES